MEDEIDLAQYVKTIFKHWKIVVGVTLAAVITAGIISFATPPVYEATVLMQSTATSPKLIGDLAKSKQMSEYVLRELPDRLSPAERNLATIEKMFKINIGDTMISCTARNANAQRAALLANAWADAFIKFSTEVSVNSLASPSDLQAQIESTYTLYQQAQGSYESFQSTSKISEINWQIANANLLYRALRLQESQQSNQGSSVSGDAASLAFLLLKTQSYTSIPQGTQLSVSAAAPVSKADIDDLVSELEDRSGIHGKTADEVLKEINALSSRLEQESQRSQELVASRDTAWNAYIASTKDAEEVNIKRSAMVSPVRVLNDAAPPQDPTPTNRLFNIGIALALGLILGVIAAFVAEYFEKKKAPKPAVQQPADSGTS